MKNEKIKSARSKYWVDTTKRKRFGGKLFNLTTTTVVNVNDAEVDKFVKQNKRLPDHVYRISEKPEDE